MPNRQVEKQRPAKRFQRPQRTDWRSNDVSGVPWGQESWPGSDTGGGGPLDPHITSVSPTTIAAPAAAALVTVTGTNFVSGSVIEFNQAPAPGGTTFVSATSLTTMFDPVAAGSVNVTVRNPNEEESNTVVITVTAAAADPTSSWTKAEIIQWLVDHDVAVGDDAEGRFTKAELLDIVEAYLNGDPVDDLLGS